jgi:cell shape-determining protein MreC
MKQILEPNYQMMLDSAIVALQQIYKDYKEAVIKNLQLTWYDNDGMFTICDGVEERNKDIADKAKEITRLCFKVEELKQMVDMRKESE